MVRLVMLGLFLIRCLVWCIKDNIVFNHAYSCISNPCFANTMIFCVLVTYPIILIWCIINTCIIYALLKILSNKRLNNINNTCAIFSNTS